MADFSRPQVKDRYACCTAAGYNPESAAWHRPTDDDRH